MKKVITALTVISLLLVLSSCGGNSIVGTWQTDSALSTEYTFNADGTGSRSVAGVTQEFSYKLEGETLKIEYKLIGSISNSEEYQAKISKDTLVLSGGSVSVTLYRK